MAINLTTSLLNEDPDLPGGNDESESVLMIIIRPSICGLGIITNILSLMVFLQPSMRNLSCSVYLATKAISDFIFLLATSVIWLISVDIGLLNTTGICQLVVFSLYLTAFVSIWLVVALTIENLLCMVKPWFVQRSCNARSARILTTIIVVLGIGLYHFALWINGIRLQTRMVKKTVHPKSANLNSINLDRQGADVNLQPLRESVFLQKVFNDKGVTNPENVSDWNNFNVIRKSTFFIRDQLLQAGPDDFASLVSDRVPAESSTPGINNHGSGVSNSTNITLIMKTSRPACLPRDEFSHFAVALTYVDSLMTLLVPLIILSVTNAAIIILALRASRNQQRRDLQKSSDQYSYHHPPATYTSTSCATTDIIDVESGKIANDNSNNSIASDKRQTDIKKLPTPKTPKSAKRSTRASLEAQASRFLFSVSMTLLIFHMPSHLVRLKYVLELASPLDVVMFRWFETLYISHYAIGFFVYIFFGKNFRKVFLNLLRRH